MRHALVLVAGVKISAQLCDPDGLTEIIAELGAYLTRVIETHGGIVQQNHQSKVVAFWNCEPTIQAPSALAGAMSAAREIVRHRVAQACPSAVLDAGRVHVHRGCDGALDQVTAMVADTALQSFMIARPGELAVSAAADVILSAFPAGTGEPDQPQHGALRLVKARTSIDETIALLARDPDCSQLPPATRAQIAHAAGGLPQLALDIGGLIASGALPAEISRQGDEQTTALSMLLSTRLDATAAFKPFVRTASLFPDQIDIGAMEAAAGLEIGALDPHCAWAVGHALLEAETNSHDRARNLRSTQARRYRFTSPLLRQTAYRSIPVGKRRQLHERIASAMSDGFCAGDDIDPAAVADHFARAGRNDDAVRWWRVAAETAITASASQTAIFHLETAFSYIGEASDSQSAQTDAASLTRLYGPQLSSVKGNASGEVLSVYETRAGEIGRPSNINEQFDALWGVQTCYVVRGELDRACRNADRLMTCAVASGATAHRILALRMQGLLEFLLGNLELAAQHYSEVLSLYDPDQHGDLRHVYASDQGALAHTHLAWTHALAGNPAASEAAAENALAAAERWNHPHTLAHTVSVLAAAHLSNRRPEKAAPLAMAGRAIAQRHNFLYWNAWSALMLAIEELQQTPSAPADDLHHAMTAYQSTGARQILPFAYAELADHELSVGNLAAARNAVRRGLNEASGTGVRVFTPRLETLANNARMSPRTANLMP